MTLGKPKDLVQFNLVGGLVYRKAANFTEANTAGRMGSYAWELGEPLSTRPDRPGRAAHPRAGSVCVVGGSHARNLCKWGAGLRSACAFPRNFFELRYARDVAGPAGVGNMTRLASCGTIVLHLGQWDLGWPGPGLTPLDTMKTTLQVQGADEHSSTIQALAAVPDCALLLSSDDCGVAILGDEPDNFWKDHKGAKVNAIRTRTLMERADVVVVRFGDKYKQWNAAFDAGYAAALGTPMITLHDPDLTHALKEVNGAAMATAQTPDQVVRLLQYAITGHLN